jgi:TM2 domain-containing membrane protein YozV
MRDRLVLTVTAVCVLLGSTVRANSVEIVEVEKGTMAVQVSRAFIVPKDPLIAGLLSAQCPGLGQIYCRKYLRGVGFLATEIGCFVLSAAVAGTESVEYSWDAVNEETGEERKITTKETISKWDELEGFERAAVKGLILAGVGMHIWGVIDAYHTAQTHNRQLLGWAKNVDVELGFKDNSPSLKVVATKSF